MRVFFINFTHVYEIQDGIRDLSSSAAHHYCKHGAHQSSLIQIIMLGIDLWEELLGKNKFDFVDETISVPIDFDPS